MMFIYLTGCRPQEITRLRFRHLKVGNDVTGKESYLIDLPIECLKKKESHKRTVVPLPGFKLLVDTLVQFYKEIDGVGVTDDDFIFRSPSGDIVKKTAKTFKGLLYAMEQPDDLAADNDNIAANDTDDETDGDDENELADRTLYSFRHTFATERLYEGIDLGRLSRWMGTSVEMIEQHYGHALSHLELTEQRPLWSHVVVDFRLSNFGYDVDRQKEPAHVAEFREMIRKSLPPSEIPNAFDGVLTMPPRVSWIRTRAK